MPSVESWQAFAGVGGVIIFLGSVVFGLQRIGLIGPKKPAPAPSDVAHAVAEVQRAQGQVAALEGRVSELESDRANADALKVGIDKTEKCLNDLRLHLAENYISRDDWVPMTSRVIGMLEEHTAMLARLDERSRTQQGD